jgi:DNA polymerase
VIKAETGATFAIDEIGFLDFEAANKITEIKAGTYRYVCDADAIIAAYAIGDGPQCVIAVPDFPRTLRWSDMPADFHAFQARVARGEAVWAAWNAGFDRAVWNYACDGFPLLAPHMIIDVMAQAVASGLASDLATAAKQSGSSHKAESGKELIKLFCVPKNEPKPNSRTKPKGMGTPIKNPVEWKQFCDYAGDDVVAMRSVFKGTRQLPWIEWTHYWAGERINERGVAVDLRMVAHAAKLADQDQFLAREELSRLTGGYVDSVNQVARMTTWLLDRRDRGLPAIGVDYLIKRAEEIDDDGVITRPAKLHLTRQQVERLIALLQTTPKTQANAATLRLLQIRLYGGSKTPVKFSRMLGQHVDGLLMGQYQFNGAAQTGRFSSKGVQVHNLARDALLHEPDLINALLHDCSYEMLAKLGNDDPVARKLALLIRPTLVPERDRVFVWSDWSQIEARIVPWLTGDDPGALTRLQIFRDVDADPSLPDLYTRTAANVSHIPIEQVTKAIRQRGKVAELALGFMGGVGALQNMAAGYGLHLDNDEARLIVTRWREANQWAVDFSNNLWEAMREAHHFPDSSDFVYVGRIGFIFLSDYLGGSLLMRLPSGRYLTYRRMKWEYLDILDDDDKPTGEKKLELTCARGHGRIKLWPGLFVENATQATAADVLRGTLARLEDDNGLSSWMPVRLHTHDEILTEVEIDRVREARIELRAVMQHGFEWSEGLPLMSDETVAYYYTKHEGSYGL